MSANVRKTRVTDDNRIQVKVFVWSTSFLSPFPNYESADRFRRVEWPNAENVEKEYLL